MNSDLFHIVHLLETTSTNDVTSKLLTSSCQHKYVVVTTDFQTAGRGQNTNHWESDAHQNLLYSIGVRPTFLSPARQFLLLQVASLAICDALNSEFEGFVIKWPNDIYWGENKISGTLIECQLMGQKISQCILGTGININQTVFSNYPPNPISLKQLIGRETMVSTILEKILGNFDKYYTLLEQGEWDVLQKKYLDMLFHKQGEYPYRDKNGAFRATIKGVSSLGQLILEDSHGSERIYNFKEVKYIIGKYELT